ncbi:MAG: YraN family protein [Muribaculaceae bacterium]|nr:YraN family protein [Muribaculaceae bacterium]MDE6643546.1 YraN family protein [Muribaculaceae bacterium]
MARHNDYGKWGENMAVEYLVSKGYAIRERNWRVGHYELDIIATKGNRIVFVEVKTRLHDDYVPEIDISPAKRSRLIYAANGYLFATRLPFEPQFDVIYIVGPPDSYKVEHIPDAFFPTLKKYGRR